MFIFLQYQNDIIIREGGTVTDYLGIDPTLRSSADEINEQPVVDYQRGTAQGEAAT